MLIDLVLAANASGGLFDAPDTAASQARRRALNRRFGRDTVAFAAAGARGAWRPRSAFLSSRYMTRWGELLRV